MLNLLFLVPRKKSKYSDRILFYEVLKKVN